MTPEPAAALPGEQEGAAFFMIQGQELRWGIATSYIARILPEDSAAPPPPLPLAGSFSPFDDGLMGRWMLIIATPSGERSLLVSRLVELVPIDQLNVQPLPPLCRPSPQVSDDGKAWTEITHVALASTTDYPLFFVVTPCQSAPGAPPPGARR